ncbi:MAG: hypothetical protein OEL56_03270 [Nitrosopumilus sp.]|nr:hypothetical protein [Nitrosopumilus sp.]MDH3489447.1 hypothetical protein [Nitrosopumilus sp.]MDH3516443.1 hypothetical protein [Nitrosopumilus sp.]MDH3565361.1 hypothetical protein [Nitrosopumilus sp.]MDH5416925.1 hypothetical protein [Nitrosopumilus sp.]
MKLIQDKFKNDSNINIGLVNLDIYFLYTPILPQVSSGLIHPNYITIPTCKICKQEEYHYAVIFYSINKNWSDFIWI